MRLIPYESLKSEKGIVYSAEHLRRLERDGKFPKRLPGFYRSWVESEIDDWINGQIELRDAKTKKAFVFKVTEHPLTIPPEDIKTFEDLPSSVKTSFVERMREVHGSAISVTLARDWATNNYDWANVEFLAQEPSE